MWEKMGVDDGGLPTHLPMGVTREGQGPTDDSEADHYICWCGEPCVLAEALRKAWDAGRRSLTPEEHFDMMAEDSESVSLRVDMRRDADVTKITQDVKDDHPHA